jgi:hypothetical protein
MFQKTLAMLPTSSSVRLLGLDLPVPLLDTQDLPKTFRTCAHWSLPRPSLSDDLSDSGLLEGIGLLLRDGSARGHYGANLDQRPARTWGRSPRSTDKVGRSVLRPDTSPWSTSHSI